jgi:hypothetical protein
VVLRNFVAACKPFRKRVSACIQSTSFCHRINFFVFRNGHGNPLISLPHVTHSENGCRGAYKHEFLPLDQFLRFSQRTCPIHYFGSKTHVWGGFTQFRCRTSPVPKTGVGVHTSTSFCHRINLFVFRNEHDQSSTLGPKHMFGVVSRNLVSTSPIPKTGVGVHTSTSFCHRNHFFVFRNEHSQSTTLGPKLMF